MKRFLSLRIAATAVLVTLASACTSVTFKQQDLAFNFDAQSDSLTLELEYLDVGPVEYTSSGLWGGTKDPEKEQEQRLKTARQFVGKVARGDRIFIAFVPYMDWDLDRKASFGDLDEAGLSILGNISVVEARASLGREGELNLYQKIHVPNLSSALAVLNSEMRKYALGQEPKIRTTGSPMQMLEARNEKIFLADAKAGKDWVTWTEAGLEVSLPICSAYSLEVFREMLTESDEATGEELKDGVVLMRQAFAAAKDFRIESDHIVMVFGDENGDINFSFRGGIFDTLPDYREGFVDYLKDEGMTFPAIFAKGE
ncbi:MAG: hypothetical protein ACJAZ8_001926 [Planctomycetota bacterium]|jgi:hypothetical protein